MEHQIDKTWAGKPLEIRQGDTVVLTLVEHGTSGYQWSLVAPDGWAVRSDVVASGEAPGAASQRKFEVVASGSGTFELVASEKRSWEQEASTVLRFPVTVR